jgi:hypothetical protein
MNTYKTPTGRLAAALIFSSLICATALSAQEPLNVPAVPNPEIDRASCQQVNWHVDLLGKYPWVSDACHEVIIVDGAKWARFEAVFLRMNSDGSVTSDFKNRQGRSRGNIALMPMEGQRVTIDGREVRFSELQRGQTLNFYVPEGAFAFAAAPGLPPEQYARVVEYTDEPEPAMQGVQLAQVDRRPAQPITRLPSTAGPLPLLAVGGLALLITGLALTAHRRYGKHSRSHRGQ